MLKKYVVLAAIVSIVPALAQNRPADAVTAVIKQYQDKRTECSQKLQAKALANITAYMHCSYDGYTDALRDAGAVNLDVVGEMVAGEFLIGDKVDQNKISEAEGFAEETALVSHANAELQKRSQVDAAAAQKAAQQQACMSAALAATRTDPTDQTLYSTFRCQDAPSLASTPQMHGH